MTEAQKNFIEKVGALAASDMHRSGILASLTIAQAILESGWGKSGLAVDGKALFGIKAGSGWTGKVYNSKTKECYDGINMTDINASFRAYDCWEDSIADHSKLFNTSQRYYNLRGLKDYKLACKYVREDGYATDPQYTDKLLNIIETYGLTKYDTKNNPLVTVDAADMVAIRAGAIYGGLSTARGKAVPHWVSDGRKHTVSTIAVHHGESEALLKEINSWIAVRFLYCVP